MFTLAACNSVTSWCLYEAREGGNTRQYDQRLDAGGEERNSQGYDAAVGVALDLQATFGELYAGYLQQFYEDSAWMYVRADLRRNADGMRRR